MIAWSIAAAIEAECFDRIIVSTDDDEIAAVAREAGAETPFVRPAHLADGRTGTNPVVGHATRWLHDHGEPVEQVCCVYATAPLIRSDDLLRGLEIHRERRPDFVAAVTTFDFPVQRAVSLDSDGFTVPMFPENIGQRSQDLPEAFHDAGQFYWGGPTSFEDHGSIFEGAKTIGFVIDRWRVQDIDSAEDWRQAELMAEAISQS